MDFVTDTLSISTTVLAALGSLIVSIWLVRRLCDPRSRFYILDHPNERSLHTRPTPRSGGIAILAGLAVGALIALLGGAELYPLAWLLVATFGVAAVSYLDDRRSLPVATRFLVHIGVAVVLILGGLSWGGSVAPSGSWALPAWLSMAISAVFIVWMINLYNFMDGMDGLAGGMAVLGFGALAVIGGIQGDATFMTFNIVVAAGALGFLVQNFPPARIFMGDVGSSALGALAAGTSLWGIEAGLYAVWVPLLVFSPFIVDASVTLLRRLLHGEKIWQAHRSHYYQRLVQLGWGHRRTLWWEYALMAACAASAMVGNFLPAAMQAAILVFWLIMYPVGMIAVHRLEIHSQAHR